MPSPATKPGAAETELEAPVRPDVGRSSSREAAEAESETPISSDVTSSSDSRSAPIGVPLLPESPSGSLLWRIRGVVRTMRPHQWVKNTFVLAPVVFAKELTSPSLIIHALAAFGIFCLLAGAVYTLNDLVDAPADRLHPVKRHRPIASGCVPIPLAKAMVGVLLALAIAGSLFLPWAFLITVVAYFAQNLAYSFGLKKIAWLDVGCIAAGFVLRVLAGGFATETPISRYMIACTASLALFLGFGKRRHELAGHNAKKQRAVLESYSPRALTVALALTGAASIGIYLAYTLDKDTQALLGSSWLPLTTIHPIFGLIRFIQLLVGRPKAESPTQEILRDVPFVLNLVLWVIEVIALLYQVKLSA